MNINVESFDFDYGKQVNVYAMMSPVTKRLCRLKQAAFCLFYIFAIAVYITLTLLWFKLLAIGNISAPAGEDAVFIAILGIFSGPIVGLILLRYIFNKISMYIKYYIPYTVVDDKGRAVIKHYKSSSHFLEKDLTKYGRIAPSSGATVFNIPYEYSREYFWEAINAGKQVSGCPMLVCPEPHEKRFFEGRSKVWVYKSALDLRNTSTFKEQAKRARDIVQGNL